MKLLFWSVLLVILTQFCEGKRERGYQTVHICDGDHLNVTCPLGELIHIVRANYGRYSLDKCNDDNIQEWNTECTSHRSYIVAYKLCTLRPNCYIEASTGAFGDPCPGISKYLELQYRCMLDSTATSAQPIPTSTPGIKTTSTVPPSVRTFPVTSTPLQTTIFSHETTTPTPVTTLSHFTAKQSMVIESFKSGFQELPEKSDILCSPRMARNLFWNWTYPGQTLIQRCPDGSKGFAKWYCAGYSGQWETDNPDMSDCKSLWLDIFQMRLENSESMVGIANELSVYTRNKPIYGGDLHHISRLLQQLISFISIKVKGLAEERTRFLRELVDSVLEICSNVLEGQAWRDLTLADQKIIMSRLIKSIKDSGWLLADTHSNPVFFTKASRHALVTVQSVESKADGEIYFPSLQNAQSRHWLPVQDSVSVPTQALLSASSSAVVKAVFYAFKRFEDFVETSVDQTISTNTMFINSHVVGLASGKAQSLRSTETIYITFKHTRELEVVKPVCAHLNLESMTWSNEGCWLITTNNLYSVCACDAFNTYALLVEDTSVVQAPRTEQNYKNFVTYLICGLAALLFLALLILIQMFRSSLLCCGCQNRDAT